MRNRQRFLGRRGVGRSILSVGEPWSFIGSASVELTAGASGQTLALPSDVEDNDVLLWLMATDGGAPAAPTGFTEIEVGASSNPGWRTAWKAASSDTQIAGLAAPAGRNAIHLAGVWRPGGGKTPSLHTQSAEINTGATTASFNGVTTTVPNCLIIPCAFQDDDVPGAVSSYSAGYNDGTLATCTSAAAEAGASVAFAWKLLKDAGTETPGDLEWSTPDAHSTMVIAFRAQ